jgi:hypothetical protein
MRHQIGAQRISHSHQTATDPYSQPPIQLAHGHHQAIPSSSHQSCPQPARDPTTYRLHSLTATTLTQYPYAGGKRTRRGPRPRARREEVDQARPLD